MESTSRFDDERIRMPRKGPPTASPRVRLGPLAAGTPGRAERWLGVVIWLFFAGVLLWLKA